MARHGKRVRVATGIYRDKTGHAISVKVRGVRREQRHPLNATTAELRAARKRLIETLEAETPEAADRGTIADVVARYLKRLPDGSYADDRALLLAPWVKAHGTVRFASLTRVQIQDTLATWKRDGLSPTTRNHRLSALRVVWRTIATDDSREHPCERVKREPAPKVARNRARRIDLIARVLRHVETGCNHGDRVSHARAQLMLLAWTGQPASMLARIRPEHVRWNATPPEMYLQPRRKGAGVDAAWVPLLPQASTALKAWLQLEAWETPWHAGVLRLAWRRAIVRTQQELATKAKRATKASEKARLRDDAAALSGMRVYDLRHSFAVALAQCGDVYAVSEYLRHSDIRLTTHYMQGASSQRMKAGIASLFASLQAEGIKT